MLLHGLWHRHQWRIHSIHLRFADDIILCIDDAVASKNTLVYLGVPTRVLGVILALAANIGAVSIFRPTVCWPSQLANKLVIPFIVMLG